MIIHAVSIPIEEHVDLVFAGWKRGYGKGLSDINSLRMYHSPGWCEKPHGKLNILGGKVECVYEYSVDASGFRPAFFGGDPVCKERVV
jgi:hypothetical protein